MNNKMSFMAALLAATVLSGAAYAKTLVYCSEASPANFIPAHHRRQHHASRTIYSHRRVRIYGTNGAGPRRQLHSTMADYTFHLHPGVKFQTTDYLPTRDLTATTSFSRSSAVREGKQWNGDAYLPNLTWDYYTGMDMPKYVAKWKGR